MTSGSVCCLALLLASGWPVYGFDYANARHTPALQIDAKTVGALEPVWQFETTATGAMESSPIVIGDAMYVTTGERDEVIALDAATGAVRWRYAPQLSAFVFCCAKANRGVAVEGSRVFFATLDGRLIALDRSTGAPLWTTQVGDARDGFSETMAPLAWHGMVFVGSSGGDFGIRGSFSAYRATDGTLLWRWWSVSPGWEGAFTERVHGVSLHRDIAKERAAAPSFRDAWRHGGGAVWMTPSLDPQRATIYLSTGNPAPQFNGDPRPGDNLYTNSIVALDARTGRMRWFYQETPHDVWDYDAASPPFLFDASDGGAHRVPAVGEAGKTGWLYVLARDNGALLRVSQNLVSQHNIYAARGGGMFEPGTEGGALGPASYDAGRRLAFIVAVERPDEHASAQTPRRPGALWESGAARPLAHTRNYVCAVDVDTGRVVWRRRVSGGPGERFNLGFISGTLSLGDLVFVPEPNGMFLALDARDGRVLWRRQIGESSQDESARAGIDTLRYVNSAVRGFIVKLFDLPEAPPDHARLDAPPVRYVVGGREYIALCADIFSGGIERNAVIVFALPHRSR